MNKPTVEQVAWVFKHLCDHLDNPGTCRHLIYERLGFEPKDYGVLCESGAQAIANALFDAHKLDIKRG